MIGRQQARWTGGEGGAPKKAHRAKGRMTCDKIKEAGKLFRNEISKFWFFRDFKFNPNTRVRRFQLNRFNYTAQARVAINSGEWPCPQQFSSSCRKGFLLVSCRSRDRTPRSVRCARWPHNTMQYRRKMLCILLAAACWSCCLASALVLRHYVLRSTSK